MKQVFYDDEYGYGSKLNTLKCAKQIHENISAFAEALPIFCHELSESKIWAAQNQAIWEEGSSGLYEYKAENGKLELPPVLIIPSLINRHYILELEENF